MRPTISPRPSWGLVPQSKALSQSRILRTPTGRWATDREVTFERDTTGDIACLSRLMGGGAVRIDQWDCQHLDTRQI
jgi:hypothetical protein